MKNAFSIAAAIVMAMTLPAAAQNVEFKLVNASSFTLTYIYASPSNEDAWGEDLLGEVGILETGYEGTVLIGDGSDQCLYDFRFETAEGAELDVWEVDICTLDSYTLSDE